MGLCGSHRGGLAIGAGLLFLYVCLEWQHIYETALRVPPTQRVVRDASQLRLPTLYFCPADRSRSKGVFEWNSYDCLLSYKTDHTTCPAKLQNYEGQSPSVLHDGVKGSGAGAGGQCLEFGTHMIGVKEEHSAAWNEITLRASFHPPEDTHMANVLQEVELGYLPAEWQRGMRGSSEDEYYYPLLRVPIFYATQGANAVGVATRTFISKEVDRGLKKAGRYWYTYGAMQIAVENATLPKQHLVAAGQAGSGKRPLGVVHVVITLEDFQEFDFQVVSAFFPMLGTLGEVAGVAALLAWLCVGPRASGGRSQGHERGGGGDEAGAGGGSIGSTGAGVGGLRGDYDHMDGEEDEEEGVALLATEATGDKRGPVAERTTSKALLGSEVGTDGL